MPKKRFDVALVENRSKIKINEKMSGIDLLVSKKKRKETDRKKTFIK